VKERVRQDDGGCGLSHRRARKEVQMNRVVAGCRSDNTVKEYSSSCSREMRPEIHIPGGKYLGGQFCWRLRGGVEVHVDIKEKGEGSETYS
jgi:hypothetical protein